MHAAQARLRCPRGGGAHQELRMQDLAAPNVNETPPGGMSAHASDVAGGLLTMLLGCWCL